VLEKLLQRDGGALRGPLPAVFREGWTEGETDTLRVHWLEARFPWEENGEQAFERAIRQKRPDCVVLALDNTCEPTVPALLRSLREVWRRVFQPSEEMHLVAHVAGDAANAARLRAHEDLGYCTARGETKPSLPVLRVSTDLQSLAHDIFSSVPLEARLETARAFRVAPKLRHELADEIADRCASIAATVGLTPLPLSDIWLLAPLQVLMVSSIAYLGTEARNIRSVAHWLAGVGVTGGVGLGLRWTAQQLTKLLPGVGSVVSAGIAGFGTRALARTATSHFLRPGKNFVPTHTEPSSIASSKD
jgi:uncharacterized protein (DUF697 family)